MSLSVQVSPLDDAGKGPATLVKLVGRFDTLTAPQGEKELEPVVAGPAKYVIFDLAGLTFISSAGLRVLLGTRKALSERGAQLHLINLQPQIAKVLDIVKALPGINIFKSLQEMDEYLAAMQRKVEEGGS
ncbi:MAG TPA: STAS domain-containing protein [Vicinamibacteria bacterium]|nr:STAS domain-containing protein [Vicinamibacteria bacterium]